METLEPPKAALPDTDEEIHLLLERDRHDDWRRWKSAAIVSAGFHVVLLGVFLLWPEGDMRYYEERMQPPLQITHLYTPTDITQKAPNKGKLSKEFRLAAVPAPPVAKAVAPKVAAPAPPPPQAARAQPQPVFVEPPKIESPKTDVNSQTDQLAKLNAPPPIAPPAQQPKIVFENAAPPPPPPGGRAGSALAIPNASVDAAIHDLATGGGGVSGGKTTLSEMRPEMGSTGTGVQLPELRSDPMGVDFRPYLIQVLTAVRRNWFAVYPAAAKSGLRGQAVLEFAIGKAGQVTKVIYSSQTGSKPLDEAAVAAISASNPLPPLPKEYKGDRIVLRLTFMYNVQR